MKKLSMMLVCVMLAAFLGGCGASVDAAGYISAILDNYYKNDSSEFVSMKIGTAEEAAEIYEASLKSDVDALVDLSNAGPVSDEQYEQLKEIMEDIYTKTRYTVDGAEKQDDGSYIVTISYEQINVFVPAIEAYVVEIQNLEDELLNAEEYPSKDEIRESVITAYIDSFKEALANVTYDESATAAIKVELKNRMWQPDADDVLAFETNLFDFAALTESMGD